MRISPRYLFLCLASFLGPLLWSPLHAANAPSSAITFYDGGWENIKINNEIASYIIQHGFGLKTRSVSLDIPGMQHALVTGDVDINMEMFVSLMPQWVEDQLKRGTIADLGPTYERLSQGYYVPSYMIKGDPKRNIAPTAPDLKGVTDLGRYSGLFRRDPRSGKALWYSCLPTWACREINIIKISAYGLSEKYALMEPKTESSLNDAIVTAYKKGEPFVTYYWDPSPLMGTLDLTLLQEPTYSAACWNSIKKSLEDFPNGAASDATCAYQDISLNKYVSASFAGRNPQLVDFLKAMFVGTNNIRYLGSYMVKEGVSSRQTAMSYLRTHSSEWRKWVPEDIYVKVANSLEHDSRK